MKAPAPAFSFYPKDILSDEAAASMTDEELGVYVRLLCHAWLEGSIPADMDRLAKMTRRRRPAFEKLWKAIGPCWRQADDEPGRLVQGRLEQERGKQRSYGAPQSERAKAGAKARRGAAVAQPWHGQRTSQEAAGSSLPSPSPSPSPDNGSTYLPTARANPLVAGRRVEMERECLALVEGISKLTAEDPIEVMAGGSHYPGARRTAINPASL